MDLEDFTGQGDDIRNWQLKNCHVSAKVNLAGFLRTPAVYIVRRGVYMASRTYYKAL